MEDSQSARRKPKRFFSDEFKRDAIRQPGALPQIAERIDATA